MIGYDSIADNCCQLLQDAHSIDLNSA